MDEGGRNHAEESLVQAVRMVVAAVLAAVVTASVVIAVGQAVIGHQTQGKPGPGAVLMQTGG